MERENFTTKFTTPITLDINVQYAVGLNRIINMSFTWFNVNSGYNNQLITFSKDNGTSFTYITFPAGVWNYRDINQHHRIANNTQDLGFEARRPLTTGNNAVNVIIPLDRYSFFEELKDKMLVPMQLEFNLQLQNDDELLQKAAAADDGRVVIDRFLLWVPKLTPKDSLYDKFVSSFSKGEKWTYLREMYEESASTNSSGFFQISSSINKVKAIFAYLQRAKTNNVEANPYEFYTYNTDQC